MGSQRAFLASDRLRARPLPPTPYLDCPESATARSQSQPRSASDASENFVHKNRSNDRLFGQSSSRHDRPTASELTRHRSKAGLASTPPELAGISDSRLRWADKKTSVTNPRVIVEITSDSTEDYHYGEKLTHYKQIPSLEAIVIVSHREAKVDVWSRPTGSTLCWSRMSAAAGESAVIPALGCLLNVDSIWRAAAERT